MEDQEWGRRLRQWLMPPDMKSEVESVQVQFQDPEFGSSFFCDDCFTKPCAIKAKGKCLMKEEMVNYWCRRWEIRPVNAWPFFYRYDLCWVDRSLNTNSLLDDRTFEFLLANGIDSSKLSFILPLEGSVKDKSIIVDLNLNRMRGMEHESNVPEIYDLQSMRMGLNPRNLSRMAEEAESAAAESSAREYRLHEYATTPLSFRALGRPREMRYPSENMMNEYMRGERDRNDRLWS